MGRRSYLKALGTASLRLNASLFLHSFGLKSPM